MGSNVEAEPQPAGSAASHDPGAGQAVPLAALEPSSGPVSAVNRAFDHGPANPGLAPNLEPRSPIQALSKLASSARFFRSADGRFYAQVPVAGRQEIYGLKSAGFRDWLIDVYLTHHTEAPSNWAIRRVVAMLEARARFNRGIARGLRPGRTGQPPRVTNLVISSTWATTPARPSRSASEGWSVVERPGVYFRRPAGLLSLASPVRGGSIDLLRPYVNLSDADFRLMIAWLTAALRPVGTLSDPGLEWRAGVGKEHAGQDSAHC